MKKWSEYSGSEKGMVIVIGVMLIAVCLSFGRIQDGFRKGITFFFAPSVTEQNK